MNHSTSISSTPVRPAFFRATLALVSAVAVFALAPAAAFAGTRVPTPVVSTDEATQKTLADLDRLLDASTQQFEETLRQNVDRLEESAFRKSNPDIDALLTANPEIVPALKLEPHFMIHRYVARRASGPLLRPDVLAFDAFLRTHAEIRKALHKDPAQMLDPSFLEANPSLGTFFDEHPGLSTVLFEQEEAAAAPAGA